MHFLLVAILAATLPAQTAHRKIPYVGAMAAEAKSGSVLFEDKADVEAYPASVSKLMTLLLVMEDVKSGKYSLDDMVEATDEVRFSEASWVGLKTNDKMSVRDLCTVLMVESANDAAIALGVKSAGSLAAFVNQMNARAAKLGMKRTKYFSPNGLPPSAKRRYPWKEFNVSTARDQLILAKTLIAIPEVLDFTSVKTCALIKTKYGFRVQVTRKVGFPEKDVILAKDEQLVKHLCNHNNIMVKDKLKIINPNGKEAVDGLKTGFIESGGSSIVLTGSRGDKRVIVVVLGSINSKERDANARRMLADALSALSWY